jgi:hypothetical protein
MFASSTSTEANRLFGLECNWQPEALFLQHENALASNETLLNALLNNIRRQPEQLQMHIWRIFLCLRDRNQEQLYAALVDLLLTLDGRGLSLAARLLNGCRSQLQDSDYNHLCQFHQKPQLLKGNRYTLFTRGLVGSAELFQRPRNSDDDKAQYDVLQIARDFIEYSQLDEAMDILEAAILQQPSRPELQQLLLEIYTSTRHQTRFRQFYQQLMDLGFRPSEDWQHVWQSAAD